MDIIFPDGEHQIQSNAHEYALPEQYLPIVALNDIKRLIKSLPQENKETTKQDTIKAVVYHNRYRSEENPRALKRAHLSLGVTTIKPLPAASQSINLQFRCIAIGATLFEEAYATVIPSPVAMNFNKLFLIVILAALLLLGQTEAGRLKKLGKKIVSTDWRSPTTLRIDIYRTLRAGNGY